MQVRGKLAIVTGGASGLGRGAVEALRLDAANRLPPR